MADVAFQVSGSSASRNPSQDSNLALLKLLRVFRAAEPNNRIDAADKIVRHISVNFLRLKGEATPELGQLVLSGARALIEVGRSEELERLIGDAGQAIERGDRVAGCYLAMAHAHQKRSTDDVEGAVKAVLTAGKLLHKIKSTMLSAAEAKSLLSEYTHLLGELSCEYAREGGDLEHLAARGMELIRTVNTWGLALSHLAAGGYVAVGLWRLASAAESDVVPRNSVEGDAPALVYGLRSAITGWERIGGDLGVLMTCNHQFGHFLLSRGRLHAAASYLNQARELAEGLPDGLALSGILLDQLQLREQLPQGSNLKSLDDLDASVKAVWGFLNAAEAPLSVLSRFAFRTHILSRVHGQSVVTDNELDTLIVRTLEHVSSVGVPDSLPPVLFCLGSQSPDRLVRIIKEANEKFPPTDTEEDGINHVIIDVIDYLFTVGSMQARGPRSPIDALIGVVIARDEKVRSLMSEDPEDRLPIEYPRFQVDLFRTCRSAFDSPGALPRESEEVLLLRLLKNLHGSESREGNYEVCTRIAGILVMLNSQNPKWRRIEHFSSKAIKILEPFVLSGDCGEGDVKALALCHFVNAAALNGMEKEWRKSKKL